VTTALVGVVLAACGGENGPGADQKREVVEQYAAGVYSAYSAALASATEMDAAIDAFAADPTDETMTAAKHAWLAARDDYGPTEVFRFYGGPIDNDDTGTEGLINAWPLDEAYIDYVEGDETAGIVNRPGGRTCQRTARAPARSLIHRGRQRRAAVDVPHGGE
jgi:putative iron-regulated protein